MIKGTTQIRRLLNWCKRFCKIGILTLPDMKFRHNALRQLRLLRRHIRFSSIVCLGQHESQKLQALKTLYQVTNRFLERLGVEYWLIHGTLLGHYRLGRPLPGDVDIDFGASEQYFDQILGRASDLPNGFNLHDTSFNHYGPKLYVSYKGWEADIYFYKEEANQLKPYEKDPKAGYESPLKRDWIFPLQPIEFWEEATYAPNDAEAVLKTIYGDRKSVV